MAKSTTRMQAVGRMQYSLLSYTETVLNMEVEMDIKNWATIRCNTYITNDYSVEGGRIDAYEAGDDFEYVDFFFSDTEQGHKEMTMFMLRWA
jgi:hypothetical protein